MTTDRQVGKRGRLPKKPEGERFAIQYVHEYATLPPAVYPVDVTGGVTDWLMLGNGPDPTCTTHPEGVGDCTFAGRQHYRMAKAAAGQLKETWESSNELVREYLLYDRGVDKGAVIADLLLYWYRAGKILAFAPVDHTDPAQVDAAMQAFHGVYTGVYLTDDADALYQAGEPWTVANGEEADPNEGHCIVKVRADGVYDSYITWGVCQKATKDWSKTCLDEAWVIISAEDAKAANLDINALRADINALHGTDDPEGGPPESSESLLTKLTSLIRDTVEDVELDITDVVHWLDEHNL